MSEFDKYTRDDLITQIMSIRENLRNNVDEITQSVCDVSISELRDKLIEYTHSIENFNKHEITEVLECFDWMVREAGKNETPHIFSCQPWGFSDAFRILKESGHLCYCSCKSKKWWAL